MKRIILRFLILAALAAPAENVISIDASKVRCKTAIDLWGIFFEDIDLSLDGGLYAEKVRNGGFEEGEITRWNKALPLAYWHMLGDCDVRIAGDNAGRHASIKARAGGGVANEGFFGIAVEAGAKYVLKCNVRGNSSPLSVSLERFGAPPVAVGEIPASGAGWREVELVLAAEETDPQCRLAFRTTADDSFALDCVSLMPEDAVAGLFRRDIVEKLAALKPSFLRFPGGCWVEGDTMKEAFRWKKTLVPRWQRKPQWNLWKYWSSNNVGFYEYLLLCEVLGAKPLYCINAGMAHKDFVPMEKMDEFVQDALDCIEFCNGGVETTWGKVRAEMGHPKPFDLEYIEIGNENSGAKYGERYELFHDAIRARYPEIVLIANHFQGYHVTTRKPDLEDDHFYDTPVWFISEGECKYDAASRDRPGWFVGEYAVQKDVGFWGDLRAAIAEAAFMAGLERNSDLVRLAAYAPLFGNVEHSVWAPNLIYVSTDRCFASPSYEVQRLFAENRTAKIVECDIDCELKVVCALENRRQTAPVESAAIKAVAGISADGKSLVVKIVNCAETEVSVRLAVAGRGESSGTCTVFPSPDEDHDRGAHNSLMTPMALTSQTVECSVGGEAILLAPLSLNIYRFAL